MTWVKICGICRLEDALEAAAAGADAVGLNFVPSSRRRVDVAFARQVVAALGARLEVVAVVADESTAALVELRRRTGIEWLQLHGAEPPGQLLELGPRAFKAAAIGSAEDVRQAERYGGERLLVDSKVGGVLGGSGQSFDWTLVTELARRRRLLLAGGLDDANVARAVEGVRPWGVDVASGVERPGAPRQKDAERLHRFVRSAKAT